MRTWKDDAELFALMRRELFTSVVGDVMDKMGFQSQFLPPYLTPLSASMIVAGRAMPALEADVFAQSVPESANPLMAKPFGLVFEALDNLRPGEVYICTGASPSYALWGGLMSTRAMKLKAAGAVLDGYVRDTREILQLGFPVMARGSYGQDQGPRGKVIDYRIPIRVGEVRIDPGDVLFGDLDGVLAVPKSIEEEVFRKAVEKARGENEVRRALEGGMSTVEAFETYGIM